MARTKTSDTPVATPENTPVPGGGSWHWDDVNACWAENTEASAPETLVSDAINSTTTPVTLPE